MMQNKSHPVDTGLIRHILITISAGFLVGISYFLITEPARFGDLFSNDDPLPVRQTKPQPIIQPAFAGYNSSTSESIPAAIKKVFPAVVGINVKSIQLSRTRSLRDLLSGRNYTRRQVSSIGSGFVVSSHGFVVTNQHVIENAVDIIVTFPNGDKYKAKKIGEDKQTDIALIQILNPDKSLPYVDLGNSDQLTVGEWAIAIGNPFGLNELNSQPTVTLGIISGLKKDFGHIEGEEKVYYNMIQTDAAINSGNSGGPLINARGQVIGMNTFIYTGSSGNRGNVGIAFAIPINDIKKLLPELKKGDIERDIFTGISRIRDNSVYISFQYDLPVDYGVFILSMFRGSPVDRAGMKPYDLIVEVNGFKVNNSKELRERLFYSGLKVGDKVTMKAYRDDELLEFEMQVEGPPRR